MCLYQGDDSVAKMLAYAGIRPEFIFPAVT